jgi:integrase
MKVLTDAYVRTLTEPGKHTDGTVPGLYLEVGQRRKDGKPSKNWRLKYRLHGKENRFAIGSYPAISLKRARDLAQEARTSIAEGVAPLAAKAAKVEAQRLEVVRTFEHVANLWLEVKAPKLVEKSLSGFRGALSNHIFPTLGKIPVSEIKLEHVSTVLSRLTGQGKVAMAKRCRTIIRSVLGFALGRDWIARNVALGRSDELDIQHTVSHAAAIEKPAELGRYLCKLSTLGADSVAQALRLLVLLPARPGELAAMRWEDVDLVDADWRYVISKTKRQSTAKHVVPLPKQAVAILRELHQGRVVNAKGEGWVFPSPVHPGQAINPTSLLKAVQRLWPERKMSAHGFRSVFRSLAHEELEVDFVVLELMLSHKMPGPHGATYARAQLLPQRREAAQAWGNYLDKLREEALLGGVN